MNWKAASAALPLASNVRRKLAGLAEDLAPAGEGKVYTAPVSRQLLLIHILLSHITQ